MSDDILAKVLTERKLAEQRAWKALAGYKFYMFGYWAAAWVKYNQLLPPGMVDPSPFRALVEIGRANKEGR